MPWADLIASAVEGRPALARFTVQKRVRSCMISVPATFADARRTGLLRGAVLSETAGTLEQSAQLACFSISSNQHTRLAYWSDFRNWRAFCLSHGIDPADPPDGTVENWIESLKARNAAPKTRARMLSALSSIYKRVGRPCGEGRPSVVKSNPFSIDTGPHREPALAIRPTPLAAPELVRRLVASCDDTELGRRDAAVVRILWSTGMRRMSLLGMTFERLQRERESFIATVVAKRGKVLRILIRGKAAVALDAWLTVLRDLKFSSGPIWRSASGPMTARQLSHMLNSRLVQIGEKPGALSPHMFRVAFLTLCPAGLDEKADAAGHSDPATTRLYDRASWRGRRAFELMPEIEDAQGRE
jgi:site-specific recombinase XerD